MRTVLCGVLLLLLAPKVMAQTPILVTPATNLLWDETSPVAGFTPAMAQALTYAPTVNAALKPPLTGVTCVLATPVAPDLSATTCKAPAAQLGLGSMILTLTAANGTLISAPSLPLSVVTVVIPIPSGTRLQ